MIYLPDKGIIVNNQLDFETEVPARSVLLHELVHHSQPVAQEFDDMTSQCDRWYAKEMEAYAIQNKYLLQNHSATQFYWDMPTDLCAKDRDESEGAGE